MRITVVGSGGWGTALALVLEENGHDVTLWSHRPEKAEELKRTRENPMLKGVALPEGLHLTADLAAAGESEVVVMVTPSYAVRETAAKLRGIVKPGTVIVSASKGIERGSSLRLSQVIDQELGGSCPVVVLSGPSHAEEVGRHIPTGVVAAADIQIADRSAHPHIGHIYFIKRKIAAKIHKVQNVFGTAFDRRPVRNLFFGVKDLVCAVSEQKFGMHVVRGSCHHQFAAQLFHKGCGLQRILKIIADGNEANVVILNAQRFQKFSGRRVADLRACAVRQNVIHSFFLRIHRHDLVAEFIQFFCKVNAELTCAYQ